MENDQHLNGKLKSTTEFHPKEFLLKYISHLPWVLFSVALFLSLAYLQIRYTNPIYLINGKLLFKDDKGNAVTDEGFAEIFMMQAGNQNLEDQVELIKSSTMASRVVKRLNLQLTYLNEGNIRTTTIYYRDCPFRLDIISLKDSSHSFNIPITIIDQQKFRIDENTETLLFGQIFQLSNGVFKLERTGMSGMGSVNNTYYVVWQPAEAAARNLAGKVKVVPSENRSNVLNLSIEHENPRIGRDILNQFMIEYDQFNMEDRKQAANNTIDFIDSQLDSAKRDLSGIEMNLKNYRETNRAFSVSEQTTSYFKDLSETERLLTEQEVRLKVVDFLINYVTDNRNPYRMVPASLGIEEPSLLQSITEYNKLQLQRETSLETMPASNPLIRDMEIALAKLRNDIIESLKNVRLSYDVVVNDLKRKTQSANTELRSMPGKEKRLLEIARQQKIQEELYSFLLTKKLETSIGSAASISNSQVLEPAYYSNTPISPNKRGIYTLMIFAGLAIPIGIIFLTEWLNDKVKSKADVTNRTDAPILGEVGHSEVNKALIITKNNRKFIAEQFRILRSNLQYFLPKKDRSVILVTSSSSGEGKSFISTNMAAVLAVTGKRTVILEFDIRKPKIIKGLGIEGSYNKGITNYLIGNSVIDEIIYPVPEQEDLFVIPCGPIPPNPAELILSDRLVVLFEEVKKRFDYVIIDSAPVGLVSDSFTLGQFAEATVYIVRHNHSYKKQVELINELYKDNKLPRISIVINDIRVKAGYGGYYGYGGYGYTGYGYGYKSEYFEDDETVKKSRFSLRKFFAKK